jgi:M6 family metalloprotease-like protein
VQVEYSEPLPSTRYNPGTYPVIAIRNLTASKGSAQAPANDSTRGVTGSQPWVSVLCKFSDVADEPKDLSFFKAMYANSYPGLDHYWREVSYQTANIAGSDAAGWFTLPNPESFYNPSDTTGGTDLEKLRDDCLATADATIDFSQFEGINMMFNTDFDNGYAWGGGSYLSLDGETKVWSITWEPPWAYANITVMAHEMGHGFGLPHSSGTYGLTYDNVWDVMSDTWTFCDLSSDTQFGCLAQHTIGYHKDLLGWIPENQKRTVTASTVVEVDEIALSSTSNTRLVRIPVADSDTRFYTVEARDRSGYDVKLPGKAIVIHEVDTTRPRPANVIDADGNGSTGDAGAMWLPGETFSDPENGISIRVLSETAHGFLVSIDVPGEDPAAVSRRNRSRFLDILQLILSGE